jgi:hypothetical protein
MVPEFYDEDALDLGPLTCLEDDLKIIFPGGSRCIF